MSFQDQRYEDVLVTQMHSLWIDEQTQQQTNSTTIPSSITRKRKSIYNLMNNNNNNGASAAPEFTTPQFEYKNYSDNSKKTKKWMTKLNNVINAYNRPVLMSKKSNALEKNSHISISTPFNFNHLGHISDDTTFGVDQLFNLCNKETELITGILAPSSPAKSTNTNSTKFVDEKELEEERKKISEEDEINDAQLGQKNVEEQRHSKIRGVCSFTTAPIEDDTFVTSGNTTTNATTSNSGSNTSSANAKRLPRSVSERSVNSSLVFSRSNSINTLATSIAATPTPTPNKNHNQYHHTKNSLSGNSFKSLLELEKQHQRSLSNSGNASSSIPLVLTKANTTSSSSSYLDQFKTNSIPIKEEEDEEEKLEMPEALENFHFPMMPVPAAAPTKLAPPPVPPKDNVAEWTTTSSWVYKEEGEEEAEGADSDSSQVSPTVPLRLRPELSQDEKNEFAAVYAQGNDHDNSSFEDAIQASFKAGRYSRRSRLSLQAAQANTTTTASYSSSSRATSMQSSPLKTDMIIFADDNDNLCANDDDNEEVENKVEVVVESNHKLLPPVHV